MITFFYYILYMFWNLRDTYYKRQATQLDCLPSLLGDGDKGIEIVNGEEKNIMY
jgi:hypothetical protein